MKRIALTRTSESLDPQAPVLAVRGVEKSLGRTTGVRILDGVSFDAKPGEFVTVVGPSGCGKTTLLMCLAGLYTCDSGEVNFAGHTTTEPPEGLAVVFQDYSRSLLPWKRVIPNILFGMRRLSATRSEKIAIAQEMLAAVGLEGSEDLYPWQLSGGMQQRVAIARALATRSKLLLLDEPLAAVDAQTRSDLQDLLLRLASKYRKTCVLVTHDVDEAVYLADRVVVLSKRPTRVVEVIDVPLGAQRDQLSTRESETFLRIRHEVIEHIRPPKRPV